MFDSKHYVPILKWKPAEQNALKALKDGDKNHITPLIELVMPAVSSYKDKERKIKKEAEEILSEMAMNFRENKVKKIPDEILKTWGRESIFVDFSLIHNAQYTAQLKVDSLIRVATKGAELDLNLIPVLNLNDDKEIKKVACSLSKKYNNGICLRLVSSDLTDIEQLNKQLKEFLLSHDLAKSSIDLLVDIKEKNSQFLKYVSSSQKIEGLTKWRNFIFASGSFPENLSKYKRDENNFIPRSDWNNWKKLTKDQNLKRRPTFSDYTIRHPIYNESLQFYPPTASIKYTRENDWLVMKGEVRKFPQYLAHAKGLVDSKYFYGERFSHGDKIISEKAKHLEPYILNPKIGGTGNATTWIQVGINHHLSVVTKQLASLPEIITSS